MLEFLCVLLAGGIDLKMGGVALNEICLLCGSSYLVRRTLNWNATKRTGESCQTTTRSFNGRTVCSHCRDCFKLCYRWNCRGHCRSKFLDKKINRSAHGLI